MNADKRELFGTDGIRGVANIHPMTVETALRVARAAGYIFQKDDSRHQVLIGKDTRLSCYMLEGALVAGLCSMGVDVLQVGPLPTPAVAYITRSLRADAGIMISASHNPYADNGIKFFSGDGFKLPDSVEHRMEELIFSGEIDSIRPTAHRVGKAYRIDDARGRYIEFVKASFPKEMTLEGVKVVLDCANGALYKIAPRVFFELGAEVIPIAVEPNGRNINDGCGAQHPETVRKATIESGADVGMAFDGDGDRLLMCDRNGDFLDGDCMMAICACDMIAKRRLPKDTMVATVMSNLGLTTTVENAGGNVIRSKVGDRYVVEKMLEHGLNFGGEQSGHIVFFDHNTTGDGVIAALQLLAIKQEKGATLAELRCGFERFPQTQLNVQIKRKQPLEELPEVWDKIKHYEAQLGNEGRLLVRFSGTEPLLRIMVEGRDTTQIEAIAKDIGEAVGAVLG